MSEWVKLTAADGHVFSAYVARPAGDVRGALVLVQEIFGVNPSIQSACDDLAAAGYATVAPALFDRSDPDVQLGYGPIDSAKAFALMMLLKPETTLIDVAAAAKFAAGSAEKVGVIGFCYGGLTSWLSATRGPEYGFHPACAVGYYAGGIGKVATEEPTCPVMLHFGADDSHIGHEQVEAVRAAHPEVQIFEYAGAGHAFANAARESYVAEASRLAMERTLEFLGEHLG